MSLSNALENSFLALLLNATAIANIADNAASSPDTNIAMALATADPGDAGTMSTSEAAYTSYARVNVARTTSGWSAPSGGASALVANCDFPQGTGGSGTVTHFQAGRPSGGAAIVHFNGTVTPNIVTGNGVVPRLTTATTVTLD